MNELWRPACLCTKACLPVTRPRVSLFTTVGRIIAAAAVLLLALVRPSQSAKTARRMLRAFGIRWSVVGAPMGKGVLLTGNHVSWLDIVLMMAIAPGDPAPENRAPGARVPAACVPAPRVAGAPVPGGGDGGGTAREYTGSEYQLRLVAKHEVGKWPVIGRLARASGTIFVDRSRPKSLPETVAQATEALRNGQSVQVFPEGTTTCGAHPGRWRPAFLQAAIDAGAPVQRFTLLFSTPAAAFVDDETLFSSLWRVVTARGLSITVLVDEPSPATGSRRSLARTLRPIATATR
jgi:1-acyl-sn-glycerol-3-phosphate acyltransferase